MTTAPRLRRSIQDLQDEFDKGNKKPLEDVMRARITPDQIEVQVRTRDGVLGSEPQIRAMESPAPTAGKKLELR
jgi:hypothetical protein